MSKSQLQRLRAGRRGCTRVLAVLLLAPLLCVAESTSTGRDEGGNRSSARLLFSVVVPPVFRVLEVTPNAGGGLNYRVWTNTPTVRIDGREYRFNRVGETSFRTPAATSGHAIIVHGL
jgi:hypothetical protein